MRKMLVIGTIVFLLIVGFSVYIYRAHAPTVVSYPHTHDVVTQYIRDHISELSPEKEVLGGKFYITDISYIGDSAGTVSYEDGHVAYTADFTYAFGPEDVQIKNFVIQQQSSDKPNFVHEGNLTRDPSDSRWHFVYEEPGKPALQVILVITPSSECISDAGSKVCIAISDSSFLEVGDRVRVEGIQATDQVTVTQLTKLSPVE